MNWCADTPFWDATACAAHAESEEPEKPFLSPCQIWRFAARLLPDLPVIARLRANAAGTKSLAAQRDALLPRLVLGEFRVAG